LYLDGRNGLTAGDDDRGVIRAGTKTMDNPYQASLLDPAPIESPEESEQLNRSRFRRLLLLSIALTFIYVPVSIGTEPYLPEPLFEYADSQTSEEWTRSDAVIMPFILLLFAVTIWNYVELYRFKASARPIAVGVTVAWLLVLLGFGWVNGPDVDSTLAQVISEADSLLWGALLAMMYLKPFSSLFRH
jgi:hypothetical protein